MKIYPVEAGNFKLDGGAMFGVVPKSLWQKTNPADADNLIDIAARCLLVETSGKLILVDTGMGNKQSDKFFSYYKRWGNHTLEKSITSLGFGLNDITDVFLTHLHFDHVGGATISNKSTSLIEPLFNQAIYWTNKLHWEWATRPNAREKASFLSENLLPLQQSGQLDFLDIAAKNYSMDTQLPFSICFIDGHTEKQMLPILQYQNKTIVFMGDLLPTAGHIPLPYIMGYDTRPLLTLNEKAEFLTKAADNNWYLFLEHDAHNEIITVEHTEKGVRLKNTYTFNELFNA
ncbi:MBL fold metallo-hydrolase [Aquimarina agarilytica]|uniref:MBL fold metallo-hydrolase n=1 Tax=Aquimarina agarilytica TaxID=1087449 RepID=UPI000288FE09|nr:MBL fold metallo-hydrolase [Aquimarina agarilytica]